MAQPSIDGILLEWGSQLYYPDPKRTKAGQDPKLIALLGSKAGPSMRAASAAEVRARIAATVRRAPQVMVKITGGARGMKALRAHFNYISKRGKLEMADEQDRSSQGRETIGELAEDWQIAGAYVPETSHRREAFHIIFSMPAGTDERGLQAAVRAFTRQEFAEHKHVRVFHGHQAHPHVHLVVKAQSRYGKRLNPRKADLQRWREGFAQALRERGIDAQATRQPTHGAVRANQPIWRASRALHHGSALPTDTRPRTPQVQTLRAALVAWGQVHNALAKSDDPADRALAQHVKTYLRGAPAVRELMATEQGGRLAAQTQEPGQQRGPRGGSSGGRSHEGVERG